MIKRLIIIVFALGALNVPANAATLSLFAHDAAGGPEFYPATALKFTAQGRDLVSVTVKETNPASDARGPIDLALIVDCRLRNWLRRRLRRSREMGRHQLRLQGSKPAI